MLRVKKPDHLVLEKVGLSNSSTSIASALERLLKTYISGKISIAIRAKEPHLFASDVLKCVEFDAKPKALPIIPPGMKEPCS